MSLFRNAGKSGSLFCDRSNYDETAARTREIKSITFDPLKQTAYVQCFFAAAAIQNWKIQSVKQKFDPLFEDFYLKAKEYTEPDGEFCLKQIFYNGKPKRSKWMQGITLYLQKCGFEPLQACPCIFRKFFGYNDVYLLVFVDDIFVASKSNKQAEAAIPDLSKGLGSVIPAYPNPKMAPTVAIKNKGLQINCEAFIDMMLQDLKINMNEADFQYDIPLLPSHFAESMEETASSSLDCEHEDRKDWILYKQTVEGLRYLAYHTRPDIALATALLEKGIDDVHELHWKMLLQLLHYLHKTKTMSVNFEFEASTGLTAYTDVYFNPKDPGFQILGFCLMYNHSLITWSVEVRDPVSFPRSEYMRPDDPYRNLGTFLAKIDALKPLLEALSLPTEQIVRKMPMGYSNVNSSSGKCEDGTKNVAHMFTHPMPQNEMLQAPFSQFLTEFADSTEKEEEK